jgi:hypothetical protein
MNQPRIDLREIVHRALTVAVDENDYGELLRMTDLEVAEDLIAFDADLEGCEPADLVDHVASWRGARRTR